MHIDITMKYGNITMQGEFTMKRKGATMKEKKDNFFLRMPSELKEWLSEDAKNRGITLTALISYVLSEYKKQNEE